jgi:hypothetical protein
MRSTCATSAPYRAHRPPTASENDLPAAHQCDLRGKHGIFAHESLGAVDGIHQPQTLGILVSRPGFLAEEAIGRKPRLENPANRGFTAHIGLGDRRFIGLDAHLEVVPEQ